MLRFKKLELEDRDKILPFINKHNFKTYEYSFLTLYLWRKYCNIEYCIFKDTLIIKKSETGKGFYFMQPVGYKKENLYSILVELKEIQRNTDNIPYLFREIEEDFLADLREVYDNEIKAIEDIDNFDYIYDEIALSTLPGKKYHAKKNHYNHFINTYKYEVRDINQEEVIKDCIDFDYRWNEDRDSLTEELTHEYEGIKDVLLNIDSFNICGMAVYVDEKIAGFTIGEKLNNDMAIIHIEKGSRDYRGIYAFINKVFAEKYLSDIKYINREEDLGVEGLRSAKTSYHPIKLEKKYIVNLP